MFGKYVALALLTSTIISGPAGAQSDQATLQPDTDIHGPVLTFDWPAIEIGVGSYEAGPTGLTIIRFPHHAAVVSDSRGGAPGTVNTDAQRLGYDAPRFDAVVFAGGSAYGEEAITAVATGLKDQGIRSGAWSNIAQVTGAIIYDLGSRRLNEIYPDKALARAALNHLRPGVFPLGSQGAGRMAMQGGFFGCNAHSGQGAAYRELGNIKIAAFVVVNASGTITDRDGNIVSCHRPAAWKNVTKTAELMRNLPLSRIETWRPDGGSPSGGQPSDDGGATTRNTTISLIVTNAQLGYAGLRRLAIQVHTSMARAIQPFSTFEDGDTLFAVTTDEVAHPDTSPINLDTVAGEVMWDAILASVPNDPDFHPQGTVSVPEQTLQSYVGHYNFGDHATLQIIQSAGHLEALAVDHNVFAFHPGIPVMLQPDAQASFYAPGRVPTRLTFRMTDNKVTGAVLNPGPWQQPGQKVSTP